MLSILLATMVIVGVYGYIEGGWLWAMIGAVIGAGCSALAIRRQLINHRARGINTSRRP